MTTTQTRPPGGTSGEGQRIARSLVGARLQEFALAGVIVLLLVIGAILKPQTFPTTDNLRAILTQASVVGKVAGLRIAPMTTSRTMTPANANSWSLAPTSDRAIRCPCSPDVPPGGRVCVVVIDGLLGRRPIAAIDRSPSP